MYWLNTFLMAMITAMFSLMGSAYLGVLLKKKKSECAISAFGMLVISVCFLLSYIIYNPFGWLMIIVILIQLVAVAVGLCIGLNDKKFNDELKK